MTAADERRALSVIAAVTGASGVAQAVAPRRLLASPMGAEDSAATRQLFAQLGLFMVVVNGVLLGALRRPEGAGDVLGWVGAQKLAAAGAVALGVTRRVFSPRALPVAGLDLAAGLLALDYRRRLRAG